MRKLAAKILGWKSDNTWYEWRKQERPIIKLLEILGEEKLEEFIKTGNIKELQTKTNYEKKMMDEFILKTAVNKLKHELSDIDSLNVFLDVLGEDDVISTHVLLMRVNEYEEYKEDENGEGYRVALIPIETILSEIEIQLILKNKEKVLSIFYKILNEFVEDDI